MIYQLIFMLSELMVLAKSSNFVINARGMFLLMLGSELVIQIGLFVLLGVGLFTIAKRANIKHAYFAFIPFVNIYLIGEIIGPVILFRKRIKNLGLWVMILYLVTGVLDLTYDLMTYWDCLTNLLRYNQFIYAENVITFGLGSSTVCLNDIISTISAISSLVYIVLEVFLMFAFFRFYAKKNHNLYAFLSVFFNFLFPIFVFAFRKNDRFDYNSYMKMRFNMYNGQGSAGGFNNPQQPFTRNPSEDNSSPFNDYPKQNDSDDDVFSDYSNNNRNSDGNNSSNEN